MKTVVLNAHEGASPPVNLKQQQNLALEIEGAGANGYVWEAVMPPGVSLVGQETVPDVTSFGAAGTERFVVCSDRQGIHSVRLDLKRPWEDKPARSVHVEIDVE